MNLSRVLRNVVSTAGMRAAVALFSFGFFVVAAHRWSGRALGEFATLLAIFTLLRQVPLLGLHVPLIRQLAQNPAALAEIGPNAMAVGLLTASIVGPLVGLVGRWVYPPTLHDGLWLVGAALLPAAAIVVAESILVAQQRLAQVAALSVAETFVRTLVWLVLLFTGGGLTAVCAALVVVQIGMLPLYFASAGPRTAVRLDRVRAQAVGTLLAQSPTFAGIVLLSAGLSRLDFLMLSALSNLEQVGLYAAPYKLYETALVVPSVVTLSLFPVVSAASRDRRGEFDQLIRQLVRLIVTLGLPGAIVVIALADPIVTTLFGARFASAGPLLAILALVPVVAAVDQTLTMALLAAGRESFDLKVLMLSCGTYALVLLALVPLLGATGAAVATACVAVLQMAVRYRRLRSLGELQPLTGVVMRPLYAAGLMATTVWAVRPMSPALSLGLGLAAYAAALSRLRAVTREDVDWVIGALQRPGEAS